MPSSRKSTALLLWRQELRTLLLSPAPWLMLAILSWLVGYSFVQAVELFSQASKTALEYPQLAKGMNPMQGVFVPTFGAYYLVETLLLPFVVIRLVGHDKQTGNLKLLLQLPLSTFGLNGIKLSALAGVGPLFLLPGVSALLAWRHLGGAVPLSPLLTLLLGHLLYALTIACIALFASVISTGQASAAMLCLAATLGSWVLDFSSHGGGWMEALSAVSLTTLLRRFENGLLSSSAVGGFLILSLLFYLLASVFLKPRLRLRQKLKTAIWLLAVLAALLFLVLRNPLSLDMTENRRHSFNPADERALSAMQGVLTITVHMNRDDSRLVDFERSLLSRLRRVVPHLRILYVKSASGALFGATGGDEYGLIEYDYQGRHDQSYSTSPSEVLPLIHALAGQRVKPEPVSPYPGHPLVADASAAEWWFYLALPLIYLGGYGWMRRPAPYATFFSRRY